MKNRARLTAEVWITFFSLLLSPFALPAESMTYNQKVEADTFVSSGQPTVNFGALGAMEIATPTAAQPRTEETLLRFNATAMQTQFDVDYGAGNWVVTGVTLSLFSNFATAGVQPGNGSFNKIAAGGFEFDLLSNNNWSETGITWNTLPSILPGTGDNALISLGAFSWAADGSSSSVWTLDANPTLLDEINSGNEVTIFGQPAPGSTVGYLFNALNGGPAILNVTINSVPEPSIMSLMVVGIIAICCINLFQNRIAKLKEGARQARATDFLR